MDCVLILILDLLLPEGDDLVLEDVVREDGISLHRVMIDEFSVCFGR